MKQIMLTPKRLMSFGIVSTIFVLLIIGLIIWGIVALVKKSQSKTRRGLLASGSAVSDDDSDCMKLCQGRWDSCMKTWGRGSKQLCDQAFIGCQVARGCSDDEPEEGDDSGPPKF